MMEAENVKSGIDLSGVVRIIDEYVDLLKRFWCDAGEKGLVVGRIADEVYGLHLRLLARQYLAWHCEKLGNDIALEADGTGEAGRLAGGGCGSAEGVAGEEWGDADAAEAGADVEGAFGGGKLGSHLLFFFHETNKLLLDFCQPHFCVDSYGFETVHFYVAKQRAEALKWFAARIEKLGEGDDVGDVHADIIAYKELAER